MPSLRNLNTATLAYVRHNFHRMFAWPLDYLKEYVIDPCDFFGFVPVPDDLAAEAQFVVTFDFGTGKQQWVKTIRISYVDIVAADNPSAAFDLISESINAAMQDLCAEWIATYGPDYGLPDLP